MPRRRIRRPLLALIVLVVALLIGYAVRAGEHHGHRTQRPAPTATQSRSALQLRDLPDAPASPALRDAERATS